MINDISLNTIKVDFFSPTHIGSEYLNSDQYSKIVARYDDKILSKIRRKCGIVDYQSVQIDYYIISMIGIFGKLLKDNDEYSQVKREVENVAAKHLNFFIGQNIEESQSNLVERLTDEIINRIELFLDSPNINQWFKNVFLCHNCDFNGKFDCIVISNFEIVIRVFQQQPNDKFKTGSTSSSPPLKSYPPMRSYPTSNYDPLKYYPPSGKHSPSKSIPISETFPIFQSTSTTTTSNNYDQSPSSYNDNNNDNNQTQTNDDDKNNSSINFIILIIILIKIIIIIITQSIIIIYILKINVNINKQQQLLEMIIIKKDNNSSNQMFSLDEIQF